MQDDSIKDPMFDLLMFMQTYENNGLDNKKFMRKCKNLKTNFTKLYLSVDSILNEDISGFNYANNELMRIQTIEYCYLKISTIWDLAYQIADYILKYQNVNKYKNLEEKFEAYKRTRTHDFLSLSWYRDINKIRNRIIHGGINIVPFYDEKELMFNVYDEKVDSVMQHCAIYTRAKGLMVSAGAYFMYYTSVLYNYLTDFFSYILTELKNTITPTVEFTEFEMKSMSERFENWNLHRLSEYNKYAKETFNLPLGRQQDEYSISRLNVERFSEEAGTVEFKRKMVKSIADKYILSCKWISEDELSITVNDNFHSNYEKFNTEILKGNLDLRKSGPNEDQSALILTFDFFEDCYELRMI